MNYQTLLASGALAPQHAFPATGAADPHPDPKIGARLLEPPGALHVFDAQHACVGSGFKIQG